MFNILQPVLLRASCSSKVSEGSVSIESLGKKEKVYEHTHPARATMKKYGDALMPEEPATWQIQQDTV